MCVESQEFLYSMILYDITSDHAIHLSTQHSPVPKEFHFCDSRKTQIFHVCSCRISFKEGVSDKTNFGINFLEAWSQFIPISLG